MFSKKSESKGLPGVILDWVLLIAVFIFLVWILGTMFS